MAMGYRYGMWDPFDELERLQHDINRMFSTWPRSWRDTPPIRLYASNDELILIGEVPGVSPEDISVSVVGTTLTLSVKRAGYEPKEGESYHRRERETGQTARTVELPYHVEADKVEARVRRGMLQVRLPRAEAEKPRSIEVKTA